MIDVSIYQNDPRAQELLKGAEACALANRASYSGLF